MEWEGAWEEWDWEGVVMGAEVGEREGRVSGRHGGRGRGHADEREREELFNDFVQELARKEDEEKRGWLRPSPGSETVAS